MSDPLELSFVLRELPSDQHRAGLGGLLAVLTTVPEPPLFRALDDRLELTLDLASLQRLLAWLYAGVDVEITSPTRPRGKPSEAVQVPRQGRLVTRYKFLDRRPAGGWLFALGFHAEQISYWQNAVWSSVRERPTSRLVYSAAAPTLARQLWKGLKRSLAGESPAMELSSPVYFGARAANAEGVPFLDRPERLLLLHFAHALACSFPHVSLNALGERTFSGQILVMPVPRVLPGFLAEVRARGTRVAAPARVTRPVEGALAWLIATPSPGPAVDGAFYAHLDKQGHNQLVRDTGFLSACCPLIAAYGEWVAYLHGYGVRGLVLDNLLGAQPAHRGIWTLPFPGEPAAQEDHVFDGRRLLARLEPHEREAAKALVGRWLEEVSSRRLDLSLSDYQSGGGYPASREKFRDVWLWAARALAAELRSTRTCKQLAGVLARRGAELDTGTRWKEWRDLLALTTIANSQVMEAS